MVKKKVTEAKKAISCSGSDSNAEEVEAVEKGQKSKSYVKKKNKNTKEDIATTRIEIMEWIEEFKCKDTDYTENPTTECLPWVERFRPKKLDEVVDHEIIVMSLKKLLEKKQFPHLLLSGPPGTGKTSTIMTCARQLYKDNYVLMVLDINASEERGIDVVRNKIKNFIMTKQVFAGEGDAVFKLVILDEADAMTSDAQSMLISIMEEYTLNARFCLVCNYIKKINTAIQSRCVIFKFSPLRYKFIENKILNIAENIGFNVSHDGINALVKLSNGDMRRVINTLQATYMAFGDVNNLHISKCVGYPQPIHINLINDILVNDTVDLAYKKISKIIKENGYALLDIIHELTDMYIDIYTRDIESKINIVDFVLNLRNIESNLTMCQNENIQLVGIVSSYCLAK